MKLRKPKAGSKLAGLPLQQIDTIASWMLEEGLSYKDTLTRLQEVMGIHVSQDTISNFWERECVPRKLERSAAAAASVQTLANSPGVDWQQANAHLIGQKIFEMLANPDTDVKTVCALGGVLEKVKTRNLHEDALKARLASERRRFKQRERQIVLAREKFEFDAVEAVLKQAGKVKTISSDRALSSDEKREQMRRLLFPQAFADSPA